MSAGIDPLLGRWRLEDQGFKASLGYMKLSQNHIHFILETSFILETNSLKPELASKSQYISLTLVPQVLGL